MHLSPVDAITAHILRIGRSTPREALHSLAQYAQEFKESNEIEARTFFFVG
jgi:hypothetical protein